MEEQSKDLRVTNYHVLQNFTLLIKSIVEFKKYIELDIKKLNSLELREIISSFIPEVRPTDMDIPNVLIEVKEEKPRQLLIIENAPEDLSHSITSLEPHTRFNVLLLIIKTSAIDELHHKKSPHPGKHLLKFGVLLYGQLKFQTNTLLPRQ